MLEFDNWRQCSILNFEGASVAMGSFSAGVGYFFHGGPKDYFHGGPQEMVRMARMTIERAKVKMPKAKERKERRPER